MKKDITLSVFLGFVLGLNIFFRSFPINFPQLKAQARNIVEQNIRQSATQVVYNKFPQFYSLAKDKLINSEIAEYKKQNKKAISNQTKDIYAKLKEKFQDDFGQTYLMELDCWHWGRFTENVVRQGHPGDEVVELKEWDSLMLAPYGAPLSWNQFLFYGSAFLYKVFCLFKPISIFKFLFYLPLLYITIYVVVLYFFSYRLGGNICALISGLGVGLSAIFIPRSCVGWFDMEILNMIFPILIIWTYLLSYETATLRRRLIWICFSVFWLGLFCFTWPNWWFIFFIVIIYEIFSLLSIVFVNWRHKSKDINLIKQHVFTMFCFLGISLLGILIFIGIEPLDSLYHQARDAMVLNKPLLPSIWPNVFSTVGELRKSNLIEIANSAGGILVSSVSFIFLLIILFRALFLGKYSGLRREAIIILTIWFVSMLFASFRGIRFTMFLIVPLGICLGWGLNDIFEYFKRISKAWIGFLIIGGICILLIVSYIQKADKIAKSIFPLMDDTWYKVLTIIRDGTPADATLNSWWDFGDWFKVVAKRKVIFDGQSQNVPQAYWMAKALLSSNEDESIGILRMLNNGGNKAFEVIDEYIKDPLKSVLLLESVIPLDPENAKTKLLDFLPVPAVGRVLNLIFSNPGNGYFIVDSSMQPKISAISYLGNWDFSKVYMAQNFNKKEKKQITDYLIKLGRDNWRVQTLYQEAFLISSKDLDNWISRPVLFYSGAVRGQKKGDLVVFDNGFMYNPNEQTIYTNARQIPQSLFLVKQDNLVEVIYNNSNIGLSAMVFKDQDKYKLVLLDRELAGSLFVRLYFLGGSGLDHFSTFIDAEEAGEHIRVFRINW